MCAACYLETYTSNCVELHKAYYAFGISFLSTRNSAVADKPRDAFVQMH